MSDPALIWRGLRQQPERVWFIASLLAFVTSLLTPLLRPIPVLPWGDATLLASLRRLQEGGSIYPGFSSGSLIPSEWIYFPGNVLLLWGLTSVWGDVPYLLPRLLGTLSTLAFLAAVFVTTRRLIQSSATAGILCVFFYSVLLFGVRYQSETFYPDLLLGAAALGCCHLLAGIHQGRGSAWRWSVFVLTLFTIGLMKQVSLAVFAGLAVFVLFRATDAALPLRVTSLAAMLGAGIAVCAVLMAIPNCLAVTVLAVSGHPVKVTSLGRADLLPSLFIHNLWIILPTAWMALKRRREADPVVDLLLCVFAPVAIVQTLSAIKTGGGLHNYVLALFFVSPVAALGLVRFFGLDTIKRVTPSLSCVPILLSAVLITGDIGSAGREWRDARAASAYLAQYGAVPALVDAYSYHIVHPTELRPETDWHELAYLGLGGIEFPAVIRAINSRHYGVIVGIDASTLAGAPYNPFYSSPAIRSYGDAIRANYVPVDSPTIPVLLKGKILVPKAALR